MLGSRFYVLHIEHNRDGKNKINVLLLLHYSYILSRLVNRNFKHKTRELNCTKPQLRAQHCFTIHKCCVNQNAMKSHIASRNCIPQSSEMVYKRRLSKKSIHNIRIDNIIVRKVHFTEHMTRMHPNRLPARVG